MTREWARAAAAASTLFAVTGALRASTASDLSAAIAAVQLDPDACYRIRDLDIVRDDLRVYLTDGYLLFAKPIRGVRTAAVFLAEIEGGDAEVILLPPTKAERQSLASFTQSPNLNEHFRAAVFVFTDDTGAELSKTIAEQGMKLVPEIGLAAAANWQSPVRNITQSFESRITLDLLSSRRAQSGFFFAAISGVKLGNFDVIFDPRSPEQVVAGQIGFRNEQPVFDTWTSFEARRWRNGTVSPAVRAAGANEFELSDYRIEADVKPPLMSVVTRVKLRPAAAGDGALPFDISRNMKVLSATIDGQPAEVHAPDSFRANLIRSSSNDMFLVIPPGPLDPSRTYEFEIRHEGNVIASAGDGVFAIRARSNWYPSRGMQFALFDLTFRHPRALQLVATGERAGETVEGDIQTTRRRTATPVRLAGFNLGSYRTVKEERGNVTIEVHSNRTWEAAALARPAPPAPPPSTTFPRPGANRRLPEVLLPEAPPPATNPSDRLKDLADDVADALAFMSERFGPPPLRHLAVSPVPGTFGQGFPGLIYLSAISYLPSNSALVGRLNPEMRTFFAEILHAHETAHQWWGCLVTSAGYQDDWLLESLANYSALMYIEKRKGVKALDAVLAKYRENLLEKHDGQTVESAGAIAMGTRLATSTIPHAWRTITYEKGSWILHMLRRRMGDAPFVAMLGELRQRYERKAISTGEFQRLVTEFMPKGSSGQVESFFDQWVFSTGIPALSMQYTVRGKAPAVQVSGKVMQTGVADDFTTVLQVEAQMRGGKTVRRDVRTSTDEAVPFTITLPQAPAKVVLDPANAVLATKR